MRPLNASIQLTKRMKVIFEHLYCIKRVHLWIKGQRFCLKGVEGMKISRKLRRLQIGRGDWIFRLLKKLDEIIKTKKEKIWEELCEGVHEQQSRNEGKNRTNTGYTVTLCVEIQEENVLTYRFA